MIISKFTKRFYKAMSLTLAFSFLWQQITFAADSIDYAIENLELSQAQMFAPAYLQQQQSISEDMITQKQAIEDASNLQASILGKTDTPEESQADDETAVELIGPLGGAPYIYTADTMAVSGEAITESDNAAISVTTGDGDVIYYDGAEIRRIERRDGTILRNVVVDENNDLVEADIEYADGTRQIVSQGKVSTVIMPDGTVINYGYDGLILTTLYPDGTSVSWSYTRDWDGNILETVLTDNEKISMYGADKRLKRVVFNGGKTIEYEGGIISSITEIDLSKTVFNIEYNDDGTARSTIYEYISGPNIYRYATDTNGDLINISVDKDGATATYGEDGTLISVVKDGQIVTLEMLGSAQAEYEAAMQAYEEKRLYADSRREALSVADAVLEGARLALASAEGAISGGNPYSVLSYAEDNGALTVRQYKNFIDDNFDSFNPAIWSKPADSLVAITGGSAMLKGTGKNYNSTFSATASYARADSPVMRTSFSVGSTSGKFVSALEGYTAGNIYRRVGVTFQSGKIYLQTVSGTATSIPAVLISAAKANTSYELELQATARGISVYIWESSSQKPASPSYIYTVTDWTAVRPYFSVYSGTANIDYVEIKSPNFTSYYDAGFNLIKQAYDNGNVYTYSYSADTITVSDYKKYLDSPYDLSTSGLWYKPSDSLVAINNSIAALKGTGKDYSATFYSNQTFAREDNPVIRSNFRVSSTSGNFIAALDGHTASNAARRVGVYVQGGKIYLQTVSGNKTSNAATLVAAAKANTDYTVEFQASSQYIKVYLWESSAQKPASPSYIYSIADWASVRPYYSIYSGTASVSNVSINYAPLTRFINGGTAEYNSIIARNRQMKDLVTARSGLTDAQTARYASQAALDAAVIAMNVSGEYAASLLDKLDETRSTLSAFPQDDPALKSKSASSTPVSVSYGIDRQVTRARASDGTITDCIAGLITEVSNGLRDTLYSYNLTEMGSLSSMTVDRDGIRRIYDRYGNIESLSLEDGAQILYENGQVRQIKKSDGTIVKNMTFRDSGELDGALISYPDGSLAVYGDGELLQMISSSGDTTDYLDGRINRVVLADGSLYDWRYDGGNILISDGARQEVRTYSSGKLIKLEDLTGAKLTTRYYYDGITGDLAGSEVCREEEILYRYSYSYENGLTLIHDEDGNIQAYTADKKLSYILDSKGRKYSYTYVGKSEGYIEVYFPSGAKARYDTDGDVIDITGSDGVLIKDIVLGGDGAPSDFSYVKEGDLYIVKGGKIEKVISKEGSVTSYYDNGFVKSVTAQDDTLTEYEYHIKDSMHFADRSAILAGAVNNASLYNSPSGSHLTLSAETLRFGTGSDGAKYVGSDETLAAGTYNFTSLAIEAGKTLTVTPGTVIKVIGSVTVNGAVFCGGTFDIRAPIFNVGSAGSITGAVNIRCDTINNLGTITGNACMTGTLTAGANESDRDDNFVYSSRAYEYNVSGGGSGSPVITFPSTRISYFSGSASGNGNAGHGECHFYVRSNGNWVYTGAGGAGTGNPGWSFNISGASRYDNGGYGWENVDAIMAVISAYSTGGVARAYMQEMQAIIGIPTIEYSSGSPGIVNTTQSRPAANVAECVYPSSGTFESDIIELDALSLGSISWSETLPPGTAITVQTRTGDSPLPDATWSDWSEPLTDSAGSEIRSEGRRYIQYRVNMSTADPAVTPVFNIGNADPVTLDYSRAPLAVSELNDLDQIVKVVNGTTCRYDGNGLPVMKEEADGSIYYFDPSDGEEPAVLADLIVDSAYLDNMLDTMPGYILNDTQKQVYLKDSIIISELTSIKSADGTVTEYCQGQISKIIKPDGAIITDIRFGEDSVAEDFTYVQGGSTYAVKDRTIDTVVTDEGETIRYYPYQLAMSRETGSARKEYDYGVDFSDSYSGISALQGGSFVDAAYREKNGVLYLSLASETLKFGTGTDGAKYVSSDETLAAGTYNFTSLNIEAGKTLTVAPGAVIKVLGSCNVNGAVFCGGSLDIYADDFNVSSSGSVTGAVDIRCNTINNAGLITGNACFTDSGGPDVVRDDNFATALSGSHGAGGSAVITFPACDISNARYRISLGSYGLPAYGYVYLLVNGAWTCIASYGGSGDSGVVDNLAGWSNVTGMMMTGQSLNGDCVCSSYALYEMQAIIGIPYIEYRSGNVGAVNTTPSMPSAAVKRYDYPQSGTFESAVMELGAIDLGSISWSQVLPQGTAITVQTRTGDSPIPDGTWSGWSGPLTDPAGSVIQSEGKRYLQYRVNMSTSDPAVTPEMMFGGAEGVSVKYTKISDNLSDVYVRVKENNLTIAYNKSGSILWTEDLAGVRVYHDPADQCGAIDTDSLKFDSSYEDDLAERIPSFKLNEAQKVITIYDNGNDTPVEMVTAGQSITYFESGYAAKVVDKSGATQVLYAYDEDRNVVKVDFVDARAKLDENYQKALTEIVTEREAALAKLVEAEASSRSDIAYKYSEIKTQIQAERQRLGIQMAMYDASIFDLSDFGSAYAQLDSYESQLEAQADSAYEELSLQLALARARIEADSATAMRSLIDDDYNRILADIVQKESAPVIYHYYRKVLGRDPGEEDLAYWTSRSKSSRKAVEPYEITQYLANLPEYADRQARKQAIIDGVNLFLTQYIAASDSEKAFMLGELGLSLSDSVSLTQQEADAIVSWLGGQSLHFGDSAIETVVKALKDNGIDATFAEIGEAALKVEIVSGVITAQTTGDLLISMFAMRKAAWSKGLTLYSQKADYDALRSMAAGGSVIVHIDGKHYVSVTGVDDAGGKVTYVDPTVGKDGQSITVSRSEFMEIWKGFMLTKEPVPAAAKALNITQEKNIRGSGWWEKFWKGIVSFFQKIIAPVGAFLMMLAPVNPVLGGIGAVLSALNVVVQTVSFVVKTGTLMDIAWSAVTAIGAAIGSQILPGIYEAARNIFSPAASAIFAPIKDIFTNALPIFGNISSCVQNIATGIGSIFNAQVGASLANSITETIIRTGIQLGTDFMFKHMGLDPSLAGIGSALLSGALTGAVMPGADIVSQALKYGTIAGVDRLGSVLGLDPNITGLAGMMAGSLVGGSLEIGDRSISYDELLRSISPNIASECAYIGVTGVGELLGVDPRISYLAGVGIRSTLNLGLVEGFEPGQIWGSVQQGLLHGVTNIGLNFATQELGLSPLLANIGFSAISGAINAGIQEVTGGSQDVFQTLFQAYEKNALTFLGYADPSSLGYAWQQAAYISQILDFSDIVMERGLVEALNTYGASFFNAVAVNNIVQSGVSIGQYFATKLAAGQYTTRILQDGTEVKVVTVEDNQNNPILDAFFKQQGEGESRYWDLIGGEEYAGGNSYLTWGDFGVDAYGKLGYTDAELYSIFDSDIQYQRIANGYQAYAEIKDWDGNTLLIIEPTAGGSYNVYDSYGKYADAKIQDYLANRAYIFDNSELNGYSEFDPLTLEEMISLDLSDSEIVNLILSSDISAEQFNSLNLTTVDKLNILNFYVATNGIRNDNPLGSPAYMSGLLQQLALADPSVVDSVCIPLYKGDGTWTQVPMNGWQWIDDVYLFSDDITYSIVHGIYDHFHNILPDDIVGFAYSGGGDPLLQALNLRHEIDMKSVILLGAPLKAGRKITNPNVENVIMIQGDRDAIGDIYHYFGTSPNPIREYHIVLKDYAHEDYLYDPDNPTAKSIKSTEFIAKVMAISNNQTKLQQFMETTQGISYDPSRQIYEVDLERIVYEQQ